MTATQTLTAPSVPSPWPLRLLAGLDKLVTALLLAAVATMVTVVSAQVALRYGMNRSIDSADEIGRMAFVWAIFLAIPLGVRDGAHIGIDLLVDKLPPALQLVLRRVGAAVCAAIAAGVRRHATRAAAARRVARPC